MRQLRNVLPFKCGRNHVNYMYIHPVQRDAISLHFYMDIVWTGKMPISVKPHPYSHMVGKPAHAPAAGTGAITSHQIPLIPTSQGVYACLTHTCVMDL